MLYLVSGGFHMGAIKLQKIGNSLGFRVPKDLLESLNFDLSDEYELISSESSITIPKTF